MCFAILQNYTLQNYTLQVFVFDKKGSSSSLAELARNTMQNMKTIRFPHVLKYIDGVELPEQIFVVLNCVY